MVYQSSEKLNIQYFCSYNLSCTITDEIYQHIGVYLISIDQLIANDFNHKLNRETNKGFPLSESAVSLIENDRIMNDHKTHTDSST